MNENLRTAAIEGEAPVNPYSLLEAINASSRTAHTGWLIFIGVMTYLLIAVAGVTHKDLLLSRDVTLPLLQVDIGLTRFFLFAPILLVLFHLGVVVQLALLARKTLEFDTAMRMLEATDRRTHPLRLELHNFFFVQALAGPQRSRIMSVFLHTHVVADAGRSAGASAALPCRWRSCPTTTRTYLGASGRPDGRHG